MRKNHFLISTSTLGDFGLVWQELADQPRIQRVFLPGKRGQLEASLRKAYPLAEEAAQPDLVSIARDIRRYFEGVGVSFDLKWLDWDRCTPFQARVLRAEYEIPRGWVSTYGRIAGELGAAGASRAVGNALASNPFPILIPCHRAVRSTGELGGYLGGLDMKKKLLEMEGVVFRTPSRVSLERIYY